MKIHVAAVNIKSKKILSIKVTDDEHMFMTVKYYQIVDDIKKSKHMPVGKEVL